MTRPASEARAELCVALRALAAALVDPERRPRAVFTAVRSASGLVAFADLDDDERRRLDRELDSIRWSLVPGSSSDAAERAHHLTRIADRLSVIG